MKSWTGTKIAGKSRSADSTHSMNKLAALLPAVLLGLTAFAGAYDDERPLNDRGWSGGRYYRQEPLGSNVPLYYRPTMRYYGAGYTISYRYIPVFAHDSGYSVPANGATNFRSEAFHIATEDIPAWGTNPPRLTLKDPKSAAPRSAVTTIVRKKSTTRSSTTPAVTTESPAPAPAPTEAPKP
jgi:hypothetical protein